MLTAGPGSLASAHLGAYLGAFSAPIKMRICIFDPDGSASHWSPGPPAAAMSVNIVDESPSGPPVRALRSECWGVRLCQSVLAEISSRYRSRAEGRAKLAHHGQTILFEPTMKPTKPAIATRPCLISAWRSHPMSTTSARPSGSQNPMVGLHFFARSLRSATVCGGGGCGGGGWRAAKCAERVVADLRGEGGRRGRRGDNFSGRSLLPRIAAGRW